MDAITWDWAAWDDTYAFIEDGNEAYLSSNLVDDTFTTLQINLMLFIDPFGQLVYGKMVDHDNETEIALPEGLQVYLVPEIGAMDTECTRKRIPDKELLRRESTLLVQINCS